MVLSEYCLVTSSTGWISPSGVVLQGRENDKREWQFSCACTISLKNSLWGKSCGFRLHLYECVVNSCHSSLPVDAMGSGTQCRSRAEVTAQTRLENMTLVAGGRAASCMHMRAHTQIYNSAKENTKDCFHVTAACVTLRNARQSSIFCYGRHFLHLVQYSLLWQKEKDYMNGFYITELFRGMHEY